MRVPLSLLAAALLALCAVAQADDWPQVQHDSARSGYSPDQVGVPTSGDCRVVWRWHPDKSTSVAGRVQPVVKGDTLCIGFYDGRMYALDTADGSVRWMFQATGPIMHSAAMDDTKVYFGCYDGKLYALNLSDGTQAWTVDTGKPIQTAPCLYNGRVYIGSTNGTLYAVGTDGVVDWSYPSGRPILTTVAASGGKVYCGNEGLYAFCLDADTGDEQWKVRLRGQSMTTYWPVVMDSQSVVFFRTQPLDVFHQILGRGDTLVGAGTSGPYLGDGTPAEIAAEQATIIDYLNGRKDDQTFWALRTDTGAEKYVAPVLYTCGEGCVPVPPIFDPATGRAWYVARSKYARFDNASIVRRFGCEPCAFDPATGLYRLLSTQATKGSGIHCIGDETSILSADAYGVLVSARGTLGYIAHSPETSKHVVSSLLNTDYHAPDHPLAYNAAAGYPDYSVHAGGGQGGGQCAAAIVADNSIYWVARYGLLVRVDKQ